MKKIETKLYNDIKNACIQRNLEVLKKAFENLKLHSVKFDDLILRNNFTFKDLIKDNLDFKIVNFLSGNSSIIKHYFSDFLIEAASKNDLDFIIQLIKNYPNESDVTELRNKESNEGSKMPHNVKDFEIQKLLWNYEFYTLKLLLKEYVYIVDEVNIAEKYEEWIYSKECNDTKTVLSFLEAWLLEIGPIISDEEIKNSVSEPEKDILELKQFIQEDLMFLIYSLKNYNVDDLFFTEEEWLYFIDQLLDTEESYSSACSEEFFSTQKQIDDSSEESPIIGKHSSDTYDQDQDIWDNF